MVHSSLSKILRFLNFFIRYGIKYTNKIILCTAAWYVGNREVHDVVLVANNATIVYIFSIFWENRKCYVALISLLIICLVLFILCIVKDIVMLCYVML